MMANLLEHEESPYLQQHKDNPVHWYPWGDEAFALAKSKQRAIFVSIGYSSCHWCHVMEHEVFEDERIAAYLNDHFVCIKVDREERPDIDKHYQDLHLLLNQRAGGWPTSVFATPDNKPFFAGTYIPPESKPNMMGFMQLIRTIAPAVEKRDAKLFENAEAIEAYLKQETGRKEPVALSRETGVQFFRQARGNFEPSYGGFGSAPKFPQASTLNTLMSLYRLDADEEIASMLQHTLDNMCAGGLYDVVDGGFCRYSVDSEWLVPHFEKMTYDNALLCEVYLRAYTLFNAPYYLQIAEEIATFMSDFMMEENLFYSASDADTEGEEGKYFVYTRKEVLDALQEAGFDEREAKKMSMRLGCSNGGNFEGSNIIHFVTVQRPGWFEKVKPYLRKLRKPRAYPFVDKKIQTSWNAMMIKALFELSVYDNSYLEQAIASMEALLMKMNDGRLMHSALIGKPAKIEAFLEDYAYLGTALVTAYEVTSNRQYLREAERLANIALERYYETGQWYFSRGEFETLGEVNDGSYPSAVAVMTDLLLSLASLIDKNYRDPAEMTLRYYGKEILKEAILHPCMVNQTLRFLEEDTIVKVPQGTSIEAVRSVSPSPFTRTFYHTASDFLLCNNHSCFANAGSLQELFRA
ncbi:thioredoxin domain-containing protein [Sulfurimonas sp. HSL3-7]|uniref:thioredoxin domain-containing protein n=1 Tax=Sulfonitrofixus jiaomeiensis TaxID=3131938 RepID=UPI0031F92572